MDAANMLKPALARGELRAIGATTLDEYRKHIEKDAALERRFQPVFVGEPTVEDTIAILRGLKERYEVHHGVRITGRRAGGRGDAVGPLHQRPLPAGQGDRPDRRGRQPAADRDRLDAGRDRRGRSGASCSSRSSGRRWSKETDAGVGGAAAKRSETSWPSCSEEADRPARPLGAGEGPRSTRIQRAQGADRGARQTRAGARRAHGDLERGGRSSVRRRCRELEGGAMEAAADELRRRCSRRHRRMLKEEVDDGGDRRGRQRVDRHPGARMLEGEVREAARTWRSGLHQRVVGQDEAVHGGRRTPSAARAPAWRTRTGRSARFLFLGPTGVGQDRAGAGAGRVPVRRRERDGPHRHERVHGEAHRGPPDRRAAGLRRLRGGRPADRGGAPPAVLAWCCSTRSRRRTRTCSTCCCRCWTTAG